MWVVRFASWMAKQNPWISEHLGYLLAHTTCFFSVYFGWKFKLYVAAVHFVRAELQHFIGVLVYAFEWKMAVWMDELLWSSLIQSEKYIHSDETALQTYIRTFMYAKWTSSPACAVRMILSKWSWMQEAIELRGLCESARTGLVRFFFSSLFDNPWTYRHISGYTTVKKMLLSIQTHYSFVEESDPFEKPQLTRWSWKETEKWPQSSPNQIIMRRVTGYVRALSSTFMFCVIKPILEKCIYICIYLFPSEYFKIVFHLLLLFDCWSNEHWEYIRGQIGQNAQPMHRLMGDGDIEFDRDKRI